MGDGSGEMGDEGTTGRGDEGTGRRGDGETGRRGDGETGRRGDGGLGDWEYAWILILLTPYSLLLSPISALPSITDRLN